MYREGKLSQVEIICIIVIVIVIVGEISNIEYRVYISIHLSIYPSIHIFDQGQKIESTREETSTRRKNDTAATSYDAWRAGAGSKCEG